MTAALVALTACTKEISDAIDTMQPEHDAVYPDGASIDLHFSVPVPATTRGAMADEPIIDDDGFYVAVFDGSGSLKQYEKAEFDKVSQNGRANAENFKVTLLLKSSECRLHFIVNGPTKTEVTGGMESALLQQWMTDYPKGAYWQRIVLPEGITAYSFPAKNRVRQDGEWVDVDWVNGNEIVFYYTQEEKDGKIIYNHVGESTPGATRQAWTVHISTTGRPYYTDGDGQTVNVGDYVDARGHKILDGTGYFQSTSVTDAVESVPLVRNFARIKVKAASEAGNFTPKEYYLMNIPDKGTIAPYSSAVGGFVPEYSVSRYERVPDPDDPYQLVSGDPKIYTLTEGEEMNHSALLASLTMSRYTADMPSTASLIQTMADVEEDPDVIDNWTLYEAGAANATIDATESAFVFERGVPNKNQDPIYLLISGTKNDLEGNPTRWFKVELTDALGRYFRVFRDMTYFLEIGQIDGADGYETAAEAAVGVSVSDVSNSIATENLTQVSDGKSPGTSMWVEYIDYTSTQKADSEGKGEKKSILYKVYDSSTGDALPAEINGESRYTLDFDADDPAIEGLVTEDSAYSGVGPDGKSDWRYAVVQLVPSSLSGIVSGELLISGITKVGETSGKTLSRKVKYHVMPTQNLTLSAEALATEKVGEETKLTITLPDGLGFSLFPLVLKIEFEKGNMNPVAAKNKYHDGEKIDLPVESGPSYFSDNNSFYFLFTVNYSDYYDRSNKVQPYNGKYELYFETTQDYSTQGANGSNETWVSVTDNGGYFFYKPEDESKMFTAENKAVTQVTVTGGGNNYFNVSPTSQTVRANETSAKIYVSTKTGTAWTVSSTGMTATPNSGSGPGYVTLSFDENTGNTITYTATVTAGSSSAQVRVVHEGPKIELSASAVTVSAAGGSYTLTVASDVAWTAALRNSIDGVSISPTSGDGDGTIVLNYGENTSTTSRSIVVRVSSNDNPNLYKDFTLTQKKKPTPVERTLTTNQNTINSSGVYTGDYNNEINLSFAFPNNGLDQNHNSAIRLTQRDGNSVTIRANTITKIVVNYVDRYVGDITSIASGEGSISNSGTTTTWTNTTGSDSVTLNFARSTNGSYRVSSIAVTYLSDED